MNVTNKFEEMEVHGKHEAEKVFFKKSPIDN